MGKRVMVFGVFDLLHKGHLFFLKESAANGDLIVVVARDSTVLKLKNKSPSKSERSRLASVSRLPFVSKAFLGDRKDPYKIISKIRPEIICIGYDQSFFLEDLGKKLKEHKLSVRMIKIKPYKEDLFKSSILNRDILINK
jgi:FAD synthetase